jgi:hypothetical protein
MVITSSESGQRVVGYYMVLLCQSLWYNTRAEGFTFVSFTHSMVLVLSLLRYILDIMNLHSLTGAKTNTLMSDNKVIECLSNPLCSTKLKWASWGMLLAGKG